MTGIVTAGLFRHLGNTTVNYPVIYTVKRTLNSELVANLISKILNYAVIFLNGCMKEKEQRMRNDCNDISNYFSIRVSLVVS